MAIREVFAGGELDSVAVISGTAVANTASSNRDGAYSDMSIQVGASIYSCSFKGLDGADTAIPVGETVWLHTYVSRSLSSGTATLLTLQDTSLRPCIQCMLAASGSVLTLQYNSSTTSTPVWVAAASFGNFLGYIDVAFMTGPSPKAQLFVNGSFVGESPVSQVGSVGYDSLTFGPGSAANTMYISQILVTENRPTVGARVWTRKANAAGAVSEMTGAFGSLVKTAINDTTSVTSNAPLQTSVFAYQDVATPVGMAWGELWVWSRAKNDGAPPANLKGVVRVGTTNYESPAMTAISGGFNALPSRWPTNPATSAKWTDSSFNAAQIGMKSET